MEDVQKGSDNIIRQSYTESNKKNSTFVFAVMLDDLGSLSNMEARKMNKF